MIRQATVADLTAIVEGNRLMALETEGLELDRPTLERGVGAVFEDASRGTYWVVEEDEAVVAQLLITYEWSDWRNKVVWWIQSVYVVESARAKGHYRRLYEFIAEEAKRAGAGGIRLYVDERNQRAQKVYSKLGMNGEHYRVFEAML
jgi:GNAT superfamily N-acetyltransferase